LRQSALLRQVYDQIRFAFCGLATPRLANSDWPLLADSVEKVFLR
jgi:hypothetical protein